MAIPTTDAMYNSPSREIQLKYEIYFGTEPLVITRDNYLVSSTSLEEAQGDSTDILGKVSSNEITLDLYNESKIFTPTNASGPYFGLIKKGVKIVAYGRVLVDSTETEWDLLGTYYTTEWSTASSGLIASITANDKMYSVFDAAVPEYPVTTNVSAKSLYEQFFNLLSVNVDVDSNLVNQLTFAYISMNNKDFLTDLSNGSLAFCFGNRNNGISVISRVKDKQLRATLTDNDQIFSVTDRQSVEAGYNGIKVVTNSKQESPTQEVLAIRGQTVSTGNSTLSNLSLSTTPLYKVKYAKVTGTGTVYVNRIVAAPSAATLYIVNDASSAQSVDIALHGTVVETVSSDYTEGGSNPLTLDSNYVQNDTQRNRAAAYLRRANSSVSPTLEVDTRGNFKYQLGDKLRVVSSRFGIDYTGILIRQKFTYNGSLRSSIVLMDASLLEEV